MAIMMNKFRAFLLEEGNRWLSMLGLNHLFFIYALRIPNICISIKKYKITIQKDDVKGFCGKD